MLRRAAIYFAVNILNKIIPIGMIFILSHKLPISTFGEVSLFLTFSAFFLPLLSFNAFMMLDRAIPYLGINHQTTQLKISEIKNTLLLTHILIIATLIITTSANIPSTNIALAAAIYSLPFSYVFLSLQIFKNTEEPLKYSINAISTNFTILLITASVWLINEICKINLFTFSSIVAIYISGATISFAIALATNTHLRKKSLAPSISSAIHTLRTSTPYFIHSISAVAINFSDKLIINHYLGPAELGKYTVAYTIGMSVSLLQDSFHKMYSPYIMKSYRSNQPCISAKKNELIFTFKFGSALLFSSIIVTYIGSIIANAFLGLDYRTQPAMVITIGLGYAANGILRFFIPRLMFLGRMSASATLLIFNALFGIAMNIIVVPILGIWGAAITTAITFFIATIAMSIYWYKYYDTTATT